MEFQNCLKNLKRRYSNIWKFIRAKNDTQNFVDIIQFTAEIINWGSGNKHFVTHTLLFFVKNKTNLKKKLISPLLIYTY